MKRNGTLNPDQVIFADKITEGGSLFWKLSMKSLKST